jgi:oxygen-dependent protoporphyrinogen oxidase
LAESAGEHRHVLRLSYDPSRIHSGDLAGLARTEAEALLGTAIPVEAVEGFARVEWSSSPSAGTVPEGVIPIGESVAGTGLASVIAQARKEAGGLLSQLAGSPSGLEDD